MGDGVHENHIRPECQVMFDAIGRDLREIKQSLSKLMWWLVGVLTAGVVGLVTAIAARS